MNTTTIPTVFQFHTHEVRTIVKGGEPWFVAVDVCKALDYKNSRDAVATHLDDDEKGVANSDTLGGSQSLSIINESGLYALVLRSRKPEARKFAKWVTSEVLPAIRKTGSYSAPYVTGPNDILTATQAEQLRTALKIACDKLPKEKQGAFMREGWSKMSSHFGVSYRKIPQREFTEALSLAGRHAADWELDDETKPERRQLLVERGGITTVTDVSSKNFVDADVAGALMRDFSAMELAMREIRRRMLVCFGDIKASDLIEPLIINLDQSIVGLPAQRRAA